MSSRTSPTSTIYTEPTYTLTLIQKTQHTHPQSLDERVEEVAKERYPQWETFSQSKKDSRRKEIAHSLMPRSDQTSSLTIKLPLARQNGLFGYVANRLQTKAGNANVAEDFFKNLDLHL